MKKRTELEDIINFLAEAGQLKRVKRSGWWVAGIKDPESVAEHCFRCALLGYVLAKMEKVSAYKVLLMTILNDIHEARINDLHKIGHRYIDFKPAENKAYQEQIKLLPKIIARELGLLRREYDKQGSREAIVARDADILECILQAKEYSDFGFKQTGSFIEVGGDFLKTRSAKSLLKKLKTWNYKNWWQHLKVFQR